MNAWLEGGEERKRKLTTFSPENKELSFYMADNVVDLASMGVAKMWKKQKTSEWIKKRMGKLTHKQVDLLFFSRMSPKYIITFYT